MNSVVAPKIDEPVICEILEFNLAGEGYEIACAHSAAEALQKLTPEYSTTLLDVMMSGTSGYKFAGILRQKNYLLKISLKISIKIYDNKLQTKTFFVFFYYFYFICRRNFISRTIT
ncbi:MAG: response regulator [Prevotellaceae bacterium]|nr:response regulator [Prevotellaceae bacterium]